MLGRADAVLAGGTESMSRVPYFAEGARWGMRMGNTQLVDGMYRDGFSDPLSGLLMGQTAEKLARQYEISREEQDEFALRSQQKAAGSDRVRQVQRRNDGARNQRQERRDDELRER